jgi:hypothetical protein
MSGILVLISSIVCLSAYSIYAIKIINRKVIPHRVTRIVIVIITALQTAALFAQKSNISVWFSAVILLGSISIFLLSIKYGVGGESKIDTICLLIALLGIFLWWVTDIPFIALICSISAGLTGFIPTIIKTYKSPESESFIFFSLFIIAGICNIVAMKKWSAEELAYPIYIIFINSLISLLVIRLTIQKKFMHLLK